MSERLCHNGFTLRRLELTQLLGTVTQVREWTVNIPFMLWQYQKCTTIGHGQHTIQTTRNYVRTSSLWTSAWTSRKIASSMPKSPMPSGTILIAFGQLLVTVVTISGPDTGRLVQALPQSGTFRIGLATRTFRESCSTRVSGRREVSMLEAREWQ